MSIRIAIKGQAENDTKILFTYPTEFDSVHSSAADAWLRSIEDPRTATRIIGAERAYAIWNNENGYYYALLVRNAADTRDGRLALCLCTGSDRITSGRAAIDALAQLERLTTLLIDARRTHAERAAMLEQSGLLNIVSANLHRGSRAAMPPTPPGGQAAATRGFRSYQNDGELANILQNPDQAEYATLRTLFLVPSGSIGQTPQMKDLSRSRIKRQFFVDAASLPQGVSLDKLDFCEGDTLRITYQRAGFAPSTKTLKVDGQNNALVDYAADGGRVVVRDARSAGVGFMRGVEFVFKNSKGTPLKPAFEAKMNNSVLQKKGGAVLIPDDGTGNVKLTLSPEGYKKVDVVLSEADFAVGKKEVEVAMNYKKVFARMDGVEGMIWVPGDSPLYSRVSSGDHLSLSSHSGLAAAKSSFASDSNDLRRWILPALCAAAVALLIYLLAALCFDIWPFDKDGEDDAKEALVVEATAPSAESEENAEKADANSQAEAEEADRAYLAKEDVWCKAELKSDKYKALLDMFVGGNVAGVQNFNAPLENGKFREVQGRLRRLQNREEAVREMKRLSEDGTVKVAELANALRMLSDREQYAAPRTVRPEPNREGNRKEKTSKGSKKPSDEKKEGRITDL